MSDPPRPGLTDSPWFWVELFSFAALVGVLVISSKYQVREARLETRAETRQEVQLRQRANQPPLEAPEKEFQPADEQELRVPLWPLIILLSVIFVAARVMRWRSNRRFLLPIARGAP